MLVHLLDRTLLWINLTGSLQTMVLHLVSQLCLQIKGLPMPCFVPHAVFCSFRVSGDVGQDLPTLSLWV